MRPEFDGIKYYSDHDASLGLCFEKARSVLDSISGTKEYYDINEVIEQYNIYRIFTAKSIKPEYAQNNKTKIEHLISTVARYFKAIDDSSFMDQFHAVCVGYIDDFWELFDYFKVYDNITDSSFLKLLNEPELALYRILEHKNTVKHYDRVLAEFMRTSDQTAELIIQKYLQKREPSRTGHSFFPTSLKPSEFELILSRYVDSDSPHIGLLQLLAASQSSVECPISDQLRLKAKRRAEEYWKKQEITSASFVYGIEVGFRDSPEPVLVETIEPHHFRVIYDAKWVRDNRDYPTLLNNFIYLFEYTDLDLRSTFPATLSQLSIFERELGVKGVKQYETGLIFEIYEMKSSAEMHGYIRLLSELNIRIEDVFHWFFTDYLKDEFGVSGFVFNAPSSGQSSLEKCRYLPPEMDGVLKQYELYVKNHAIDRELLEMSSSHITFETIPSMTINKYAYANSAEIRREMFLMFSDQSMLHYLPSDNRTYSSFFKALGSQQIAISDYPEWLTGELRWLEKRGTICVNDAGFILVNSARVLLLRDLYIHDVICPSYYRDKREIERMVNSGDLQYGNTLFSVPEQKYLNYILNKAEFSNGMDLRNKYIHGTCPLDTQKQDEDYIRLLKIMVLIIIKINEEFCLKYPLEQVIWQRGRT